MSNKLINTNNLDDFMNNNQDNLEDNAHQISLYKNLYNYPYFDFYKYLISQDMESQIINNESMNEYKLVVMDKDKQYSIDDIEQIDEIKTIFFFILYLNCDYNDEYSQVISERYIKVKRLVIQNYFIINNIIKFGKKKYMYIPLNIPDRKISFVDDKNQIVIEKNKKDIKMSINGTKILNEKEFIKQKKDLKNVNDIKYKNNDKSQSVSVKSESNEITSNNSSDQKTVSLTDTDNKSLAEEKTEILSTKTNSSKLDDSENEIINGFRFYDENKRYIFKENYEKEIDGIFTTHDEIDLNKNETNIYDGLNELLYDKYDIENGIKSHIIFKNFKEKKIKENEPLLIEIKKSMAELNDLLNQIKNVSKILRNYNCLKLPIYIIGIICSFRKEQIELQKKILQYEYKNEILYNHIIQIINDNKINVVIGAIKDEKILNCNLGKEDFDIGNKTRIDIYHMNNLFKKLDPDKMDKIYEKYSKIYTSLSLKIYTKENYDSLNAKFNNVLKNNKELKKKNELIKGKYNQAINEKNQIQGQYTQIQLQYQQAMNEINQIQGQYDQAMNEKYQIQGQYYQAINEIIKLQEKIKNLELKYGGNK